MCLDQCSEITDTTLRCLAAEGNALRCLSLSGCRLVTDNGVAAIAIGCHSLTSLDLSRCTRLSDASLTALYGCKALESLRFSHLFDATGAAIGLLGAFCTTLRSLRVDNCPNIIDTDLQPFATLASTQLQRLEIVACQRITDGVIEALDDIGSLRHLSLARCCNITGGIRLHGIEHTCGCIAMR